MRHTKIPLRQHPARPSWRTAAAIALILLTGGMTPALGKEPADPSVEQGTTPMDEIDLSSPGPGQVIIPPSVQPEKKRFPFFDDTTVKGQFRTFFMFRDNFDHSINEAWAVGGSVALQTGYLADRVRAGAVFYTSQPLYAPDDRDGTLLLAPGQDGYTVLGQLYGELKIIDGLFAAVGTKEYDTPYINKNDVRMTPNTFEAITMYGRAGGTDGSPAWRYGGGYFTKIKERNSDSFQWMSVDAGATAHRGVIVAGANVDWRALSFGAIDYYSDDIINIGYTEARYALTLGEGAAVKFAAQFTDQRSTGNDLLTGTSFATNQWGLKSDVVLGPSTLTVALTDTAKGADMQNPWSGYPGYTSVQVKDFNRAGETAVMLRGAYDFTSLGWTGVSAYALWVHGSGVIAPNYNQDETDLNLQWTPDKAGSLRGLSFRTRYAYINQRGGGSPNMQDIRFIVNYDFPRPSPPPPPPS
jgi:hypothetical protein